MRLSVFIPQLSPQLLIDLKKIYQAHLPEKQLSSCSLVDRLIENESVQFFVTKFNDRHLGAVNTKTTDNKAVLSMLCIREVTRRRGIAKNLLKEVEKHLAGQRVQVISMSLNDFSVNEQAGISAFMLASNYQLKGSNFIKELK